MLIKLTTHALFRLQDRGFSVENIKEVIKNCKRPQELEEGLFKAIGKLRNKGLLAVIFRKKNFKERKDYYLIITAYFVNN